MISSPDADRPPRYNTSIVWIRRDLRLHDHHALSEALRQSRRVQMVFVFDRDILDHLQDHDDRRVEFIHASLCEMDQGLRKLGSGIWAVHDRASAALPALAQLLGAEAVFANRDYEPQAIARDAQVKARLAAADIELHLSKDQVIFEKSEVMSAGGTPYSVFTPYKNAWLKRLDDFSVRELPASFAPAAPGMPAVAVPPLPALPSIGFAGGRLAAIGLQAGSAGAMARLDAFAARIGGYGEKRDFPALDGTSSLSVHFRFGTLSIRQAVRLALRSRDMHPGESQGASVWLSELIWRDFYFQILFHHPRVVGAAFKPAYDRIVWEQNADRFEAFCQGRTGYPLVDAAMLQLLHTGHMHNRLRMVVASFLTKDLGIDWRQGEAWFARHLLDFDLAANNGGWQWAASTGCDAQPWFRIFNPVTQSEKFDPRGSYIRRYLPQLAGLSDKSIHAPWLAGTAERERAGLRLGEDYPLPLVDHREARERTMQRYAVVSSP